MRRRTPGTTRVTTLVTDGKDKKAGLEPHPDSPPRLNREFGDKKEQQGNLDPDDSQQRVRQTNPVFRLQQGHVDQQLRDWAKNGQLAHVLNVAAGSESDPDASPDRPRTFTSDGLNKALPGFESLNPSGAGAPHRSRKTNRITSTTASPATRHKGRSRKALPSTRPPASASES